MTDFVSADTDDLDAFVTHGRGLNEPLRGTVETLARQRNYLLAAGFPRVVEVSQISTLDNTLIFMTDLDRFVEVISETLKNYGQDVGRGVFRVSGSRVERQLDGSDDKRLDELEAALQQEGLSEADAGMIRDEAELLLAANPRFELDGATFSEPADLAAAIVQNIQDRADELLDNNQVTSSELHSQPRLSVPRLANDLHYGSNADPLLPEHLLTAALQDRLTDSQNADLNDELSQLDQREQLANFLLVEHATEAPEVDGDFEAIAIEAQELYQDNLVGPGPYGGGHRLNEPEIAYQLQKIAEQDPGRAIAMKWVLEGLLSPDERAELDQALAGEASWSDRIDRAIAHPQDGIEGAAKGTWNNTFGWWGDELADLQVGITHGFFGMATGSNSTISPEVRAALPQAPTTWDELDAIVELELEMDNIAEQGGDDIALVVDIGSAVYGGSKGGLTLVRIGRRYFLRNRDTLVAAVRVAPPFDESGQLARFGNRTVFTQRGPTCGPNSCAMGLDTLGHHVDDLDGFVAGFNVGPRGLTFPQMARTLDDLGIPVRRRPRLSIEDIAIHTRDGTPMVVGVRHPGPGGEGHAIVVDGITTRYGRRVVAIRDPHGRQYFEDLAVFEERFLNDGLTFER